MRLVYYPDKILSVVCEKVSSNENGQSRSDRRKMADKMWKIMRKKHGVGLSAPQVGLKIRMFVWNNYGHSQAIWNPVFCFPSGEMDSIEGCLSLPGIQVTMKRATSSVLTGEGINGMPLKFIGDDQTTKIWQHEIDHLDGKLIIDNMNVEETKFNKDALAILTNRTVT